MSAGSTGAQVVCRDLHLRITDTNGNAVVRCHRVWDGDLFLFAQQGDAHKANAKVEGDKPRMAKVELITEAIYHAERKAKS